MFPPERTFWELFVTYVSENWPRILALTGQHVMISGIAVCITLLICIPLGIYLSKREKLASVVIGVANVFQTIPSLALLGFLIFVFGIGNDNAICALVLYAVLPVLQNTYTGLRNVSPVMIQAARGMGMTETQILLKVQLPLARSVIIAGIRVATVWVIGTATLASAIGGGGLGKLIFAGLGALRQEVVLAGALPATVLALLADQGLKMLQNHFEPRRRALRLARKYAAEESAREEKDVPGEEMVRHEM